MRETARLFSLSHSVYIWDHCQKSPIVQSGALSLLLGLLGSSWFTVFSSHGA